MLYVNSLEALVRLIHGTGLMTERSQSIQAFSRSNYVAQCQTCLTFPASSPTSPLHTKPTTEEHRVEYITWIVLLDRLAIWTARRHTSHVLLHILRVFASMQPYQDQAIVRSKSQTAEGGAFWTSQHQMVMTLLHAWYLLSMHAFSISTPASESTSTSMSRAFALLFTRSITKAVL